MIAGRKNKVGQRISIWGLKGILSSRVPFMYYDKRGEKRGLNWKQTHFPFAHFNFKMTLFDPLLCTLELNGQRSKPKSLLLVAKKCLLVSCFCLTPSVTNYCWWNRLLRCCSITTKSSTSTECQLEQKYSIRAHRNKTSRLLSHCCLKRPLFVFWPLGDCTV